MDPTYIFIALGCLAIFIIVGSVILVYIGRRAPQTLDEQLMQKRLAEFVERGEQLSMEEIELSQPLTERVIYPLARRFGEFAMRFTPQQALESTRVKIENAGLGNKLDPTILLTFQIVAATFFFGVILLAFSVGSFKLPFWEVLLLALVLGAIGFYFPVLYLQSVINRRQKSVRLALPDALDLLTICVEAGLGFDAAISKVAEKWDNELSLSFARALKEIQYGKTRREALRTMADRLGVTELSSFVAAVIQSEQLGVSLSKILRIQSDQMRMKRRQRAEQEAHKAPIKMLIPMGLLIFPSLLIVLLTPAVFKVMEALKNM